MRGQPNRLPAETAGPFSGSAIDRSRPLQFRLDGRTINGFAGDTVLSAVLASGIDTLGGRGHNAVALSMRCAPAIIAAAQVKDRQRALAMERTLATDGAEYVTLASSPRQPLGPALRGLLTPNQSLDLDLPAHAPLHLAWTECAGAPETPADLIVVGGGVAGMATAVAAAQAGLNVLLLEASPRLGGRASLFGTLDGEEPADISLGRLGAAIAGTEAITVLTHASAFALRPGVVRVHITDRADTMPSARVVDLHAPRIVLATGSLERLPAFAGNRLPGTVGVAEAHDLAQNYGVWCGQNALVATTSSASYRLAMLAVDSGVAVQRIIDARPQPQSRFVEYSKAYGITLAAGTVIADARPAQQGRGLAVSPQVAMEGFSRAEPILTADRLVVCGGWQPDLELWHMAGGHSRWNAEMQRLEADAGPQGIVLAGNAAGYLGHTACLASGQAAIDELLNRAPAAIAELAVDPIYETPDAACPITPPGAAARAPAYLDAGRRLVTRPGATAARRPAWLPWSGKVHEASLAEAPQSLGTAELAAGVQWGAIAADSAGLIARQRVAMIAIPARPGDGAPAATPMPTPLVPAFLSGRFGPAPQLWLIEPGEARALEPGALIQPDADSVDPGTAIGVVVQGTKGESVALIAARHAAVGHTAAVRDHGRATPVRMISVYEESRQLADALG